MSLGYPTIAATIASSGGLAWAYALWPFGVWDCVAGGVCGAAAGVVGARPLARLEDRASAEGGLGRWSAVAAFLVGLWLALVIAPSVVGAVARSRPRLAPDAEPSAAADRGRDVRFWEFTAHSRSPAC